MLTGPCFRAVFALSLLLIGRPLLNAQSDNAPPDCVISEGAQQQLLIMSYDDFDQTPDLGWRQYEADGCYLASGTLIDRYLETKEGLTTGNIRNLSFHAGQMYAFAEQYSLARERFLESFRPEPETDGFPWNDYVHATIAFIDMDLDTLRLHRNRIASSEIQANLATVDRLIRSFGETYIVAYLIN